MKTSRAMCLYCFCNFCFFFLLKFSKISVFVVFLVAKEFINVCVCVSLFLFLFARCTMLKMFCDLLLTDRVQKDKKLLIHFFFILRAQKSNFIYCFIASQWYAFACTHFFFFIFSNLKVFHNGIYSIYNNKVKTPLWIK